MEFNQQVQWDARELYTKELVYRAHIVLNVDNRQQKEWLERLRDFYDWGCMYLGEEEHKEFKRRLELIDAMINAKGEINNNIKRIYSIQEREHNRLKAYDGFRIFFQDLNRVLAKKGIYLPIKDKEDINKIGARMR